MENCDADHWCRHLRVAEIAHDWKGKAKAFTAKDAKGATEQKVSTAEGAENADDKQRRGEKPRHLPQRARRAQRNKKVYTAEGAENAEKSDDKQRRGEKLRHLPQRARRAQRQQEVFTAECAKIAEKIMTQAASAPRNRRESERDRA